ncbi:MAG: DUF1045 domain-containing protein [Pseudomonadota bacterium]
MSARYAIYWAPEESGALGQAGVSWFGRTACKITADARAPLVASSIDACHLAGPGRYGFHATLKAPFRLIEGQEASALHRDLAVFASDRAPVPVGRLMLTWFGPYLVLRPEDDSGGAAAGRLAGDVVETFSRFRAGLSDTEKNRRQPAMLTARQRDHLETWGYPFVFEEYRFHLTLAGPVQDGDMQHKVELAARSVFETALHDLCVIDAVSVFYEPHPGEPLTQQLRCPLSRGHAPRDDPKTDPGPARPSTK